MHHIFKKTFIACVCMGATSIAFASTNYFYVGGDVGAADFMTKESHSAMPESHQLGSVGPVAGIFVGYDYWIKEQISLAVEGFVEGTNLNTNIQHAANTYKTNQDYNLGIRLLPEYAFTPSTVGHLVVGYVNGRFNIHDNGVYGNINTSFNQSGVQVGLGLTTLVGKNISVRLDALYDGYSSRTNTGTGLTTPTQSYTNRFSELAGVVGVTYRWA